MFRSIFLIILFLSVLSINSSKIFAQDATPAASLPYQSVNPNDSLKFSWKRLQEKLSLMLLFYSKPKKAEYLGKLSEIRLAELKFVIENNQVSFLESSSVRYASSIGDYADFIIINNLTDEKNNSTKILVDEMTIIQNLEKKFDDTTAEWRFIKQDADTINIFLPQLK